MNESSLSKAAQSIQKILSQKNYQTEVIELSQSTRTAQEAADAIGCSVSAIVKSLIFQDKESLQPILLLVSGSNRVNEKIVERNIHKKLIKADAKFVREVTGFAIGGIPPLGHKQLIETFIDEDLLNYIELWAAAGTPNAVFKLRSEDLVELTNGKLIKVQ